MEGRFVSAGSAATGTGAITVNLPSSYSVGDLLLLFCESANQSITAPSGWTEIGAQASQGTGTAGAAGGVRLATFYKFATSSESSVTIADSGDHTFGIMAAFSGVDSSNPFNASASGIDSSATSALSWPIVTTTVDGCMIINCVASDYDASAIGRFSSWSNSSLSSITEAIDRFYSSGTGGGVGMAYGIKTSAGAVSATTCTELSAVVHGYLTLALKPSGGSTPIAGNAIFFGMNF